MTIDKVAPAEIENLLAETRTFPPDPGFAEQANAGPGVYDDAARDPVGFWERIGRERVDTIYFTGGASGVRQLRARIAAELPAARSVEGDLYGSIGAGLAVEAARRYG